MKLANWSINHALMEYSSVQAMAEDRWSTCVAIGDRPLQAKSWLGKNHPLHFQIGFPIGLTTRITTFF